MDTSWPVQPFSSTPTAVICTGGSKNKQSKKLTCPSPLPVIATEPIPKDTEVLTVPVSTLRTRDTVPRHLAQALPPDLSVHGLLAADLALNQPAKVREYAAWNAVVPTWDDIQLSMPLTWPASLTARLPPAAKRLLDKQRTKFERDWSLVAAIFPLKQDTTPHPVDTTCSRETYLYAWLLVNTRTFYFVTPKTEKLPKEDHMVLQPVADLFNHTDRGGCHVTFAHDESFSFRTTRAYEKGDEVHISYGPHSNDFLLVEYGFVLAANAWDEARLDDVLVPALTRAQKESLEEAGFLGNYVLDRETVCHRTQVAARLFLTGNNNNSHTRYGSLSMEDWRRFVSGQDDGEGSQKRVDGIIVALLKDYLAVVAKEVRAIEEVRFEEAEEEEALNEKTTTAMALMNETRRELLLKRWGQIEDLVADTIDRLQ